MQTKISIKQALLYTIINYVGVVIGVISTVFIYPQDKEMLGIIRFVDACSQILFPLIVLGSTHALINFYPRLSQAGQHKLFSFSLLSIGKMAFGLFVGVVLLSFFYHKKEMDYIFYGFFLAIALACIELFRRQATNLQKISFPTFFEKIIPKITLPSIFLLCIYGGITYNSSIWIYIFSYYIIVAVIANYIYKYFKYKWHWNYEDLFSLVNKREYYWYSLFAFAGSFGSFFAFRVDSLMIPYFISYEANGTYNIGVTLASTLAIPATGVFALYSPIIADLIKKVQLRELDVKYKEVSRNLFFIGMVLYSCVLVGIEPFFKLLPTYDKLAPSIPIIYLLGLNVVINMSTGFNSEIIAYSKYFRFNLVSILSLMVLNVGLNYVFLAYTDYGILGVAIASFFSLTVFNIVKTIFIYRNLYLWPFDKAFVKLALLMSGILVVAYLIPQLSNSLLDLVIKVGFIMFTSCIVLVKTNWLMGLKNVVFKLLDKTKRK